MKTKLLVVLLICLTEPAIGQPSPAPAPSVAAPAQRPASAPQSQVSLSIQIEQNEPLKLITETAGASVPWSVLIPPLSTALVTLVGTFLALRYGYRNTQRAIASAKENNDSSIWQKANEAEYRDIQNQLDGFYGRYKQLSEVNYRIYSDLRSRQSNKEKFVLLEKLFEKGWIDTLADGDKALVREICEIDEKLEQVIHENTSSIDEVLQPYFTAASAHFRVIRLAYKGELGNDPTHFRKYLYPRQLNKVLDLELKRLRTRQAVLRARPSASPGEMPKLIIPDDSDHALPQWVTSPIAPIDINTVTYQE